MNATILEAASVCRRCGAPEPWPGAHETTAGCAAAYGRPAAPPPAGWLCPLCGAAHAPGVLTCPLALTAGDPAAGRRRFVVVGTPGA